MIGKTERKKTMRLTSPKTENSVRKVPFFGETQKILEQQFEKVKRRKKDLGDRWRKPEEMGNLVFLTSMGSPIGRYNIESDMLPNRSMIYFVQRHYTLVEFQKILKRFTLMHLDIHLQQDVLKRV